MANLQDIRIIFSDIDGTLLPLSGKDLGPTARLIEQLQEAGYIFVPCTGRGTGNIPPDIFNIPGLKYAITANGAMVNELPGCRRLLDRSISRKDGLALTHFLRQYNGLAFSYRQGHHFLDLPADAPLPQSESSSLQEWLQQATLMDFDDYFAQEASAFVDKIGFATFDASARQAVLTDFPQSPLADSFSYTSSGIWNVEFNAKGANKGSAALWLAEKLGLAPHQILTAGDNLNDVPMLKIGAISLAPENAAPEAKEAATFIVPDCREDGVENFLKQLL